VESSLSDRERKKEGGERANSKINNQIHPNSDDMDVCCYGNNWRSHTMLKI